MGMRKRFRTEFAPGDFYFNPNAGPLWMCYGRRLLAQTSIVCEKKLTVSLDEDMPWFFDSLQLATETQAQRVMEEQAKLRKRYQEGEKRIYANLHSHSW